MMAQVTINVPFDVHNLTDYHPDTPSNTEQALFFNMNNLNLYFCQSNKIILELRDHRAPKGLRRRTQLGNLLINTALPSGCCIQSRHHSTNVKVLLMKTSTMTC